MTTPTAKTSYQTRDLVFRTIDGEFDEINFMTRLRSEQFRNRIFTNPDAPTARGEIVLKGRPGWSRDWTIGWWVVHWTPGGESGHLRVSAQKADGSYTLLYGVFYTPLNDKKKFCCAGLGGVSSSYMTAGRLMYALRERGEIRE